MRILHLVHQYPPEKVGGTERYTQTLAKYQAARGHAVAVFCPSSDVLLDRAIEPENEDGAQVYRVPIGPRSPGEVFFSIFKQTRLSEAFRVVLDQFQPSLVHVQHLMGLPLNLI